MIVATAGHIDHGKTLLVRALTGVDTDRLPAEKSRGISIDIGFAYWRPEGRGLIGFVDVPGHERFIHNMLAGVCGIDLALLVVAADDGVMPQTLEHLQILNLLAIPQAIVVVTKIDRVDAGRLVQVEHEVRAALAGTQLADSPMMGVSSVTGAGIDRLREALARAAEVSRDEHARAGEQRFRFAIDRAFTVAGIGTVVTGTVFNGSIGVGDPLVVSPKGLRTRVRGIQIHGAQVERARAGDRCALNLAKLPVEAVARGDWALDEALDAPGRHVDVRLTLLPSEPAPLRHWALAHLHIGTSRAMARIAIRRGGSIAPGTSGWARLVLDRPLTVQHGDRFILRDHSAQRTLGGGTVIAAPAPSLRRGSAIQLATIEALSRREPEAVMAALLEIPDLAVDCGFVERTLNLNAGAADALYRGAGAVVLGRDRRVAIAQERATGIQARIVEHLERFHRRHPKAPGVVLRALHREAAPSLPHEAFLQLLRDLTRTRRTVSVVGAFARLSSHAPDADADSEEAWRIVEPILVQSGVQPPTLPELATSLGLDERPLRRMLEHRCRSGTLMRVARDLYYPKATLAVLAANAALVARCASRGQFTLAQYRDALAINRALATRILEFLDSLGITQRSGDTRRMARNFVPILGSAKPATDLRTAPGGRRRRKTAPAARPGGRARKRADPRSKREPLPA